MPAAAAPRFADAREAYAWLESRTDFEARLDRAAHGDFAASLSAFRGRMRRLGDPQRGLRAVHIAGTRGKGSAALMLEALLEASGQMTATFTSPHLVEYRERIRLGGAPAPDGVFAAGMERLAADEIAAGADPEPGSFATLFETLAALFFRLAREAGADWLVVETGLGGRLDATNILDPGPVLWTRIGLDHTHILGDTIEKIAAEKAAILKPGGWAVMGLQDEAGAESVFQDRARETGAELLRAEAICPLGAVRALPDGLSVEITFEGRRWDLALPLLGLFQAANLQNALAMLSELRRRDLIPAAPDAALRVALEKISLPGRMSLFRRPGVECIVDGAHCPTGARALAESLAAHFQSNATQASTILCVTMMRDKDHDGFFRELARWPGFSEVRCASLGEARSLPAEELAASARRHFPRVRAYQNLEQLLDSLEGPSDAMMSKATGARQEPRRVVAAGSLHAAARFSAWGGGNVGHA